MKDATKVIRTTQKRRLLPCYLLKSLYSDKIIFLQNMLKTNKNYSNRMRAQGILLSNQGYPIKKIVSICNVCRQTVSKWIRKWENLDLSGLIDNSRSGRKKILETPAVENQVIKILKEEPRSIKRTLAELEKRHQISISLSTIRRLCKKHGLCWKRVRRSLKSKRNQEEFDRSMKVINDLIESEKLGEIDLFYFDESGFTLTSSVPYAWQPKGERIEVPCSKSKQINVLGFLNRKSELVSCVFECNVDTSVVIRCFDYFVEKIDKTTVVLIDNASIHTSNAFLESTEKWLDKGLVVVPIARYSPELNIIEDLWKKIKYQWLPFSSYESYSKLKNNLYEILSNVGSKYVINFQ